MTSSSRRKPRTTARVPRRSDALRRLGAGVLGLAALLAAPASAVDLRDAVRSPAAESRAPSDLPRGVLRASRKLEAGAAEGRFVLRASRLVDESQRRDEEPPAAERSRRASASDRESDADRESDERARDAGRSADEPAARKEPSGASPRGRDDESAAGRSDRTERRPRPIDRGATRRERARKEPCAESLEACREALQFLRDDDIASIDLDIRVGGKPGNDYPCECLLEGETFQPRRFASTTMTWKAAGYCHKPLYFEDWELERYGHSRGMFLDPFIAGAHFFVTLPILPYKAGMQAPWECVYPLGYYRPGSCAPWTVPAVPYSARGFAVQAATVTGAVFLLP